ncbi:MAPEG family protein [Pseudomonas taiwanensis]|uniref:MAPEG family protein n=1 Tax=Pseudomonas taiwanensis TaxID=470150 RepID=UPI0015BEB785|nr:MAPEG family protein [Pseudomonas taiwanensis]NWL77318.1 MAPEG family protein [Pseudomonas taiwanensis]
MTNASAIALTGFIAWALALLVLMELLRGLLVVFKQFPANEFTPDNSNLSPFMQRLARAHANCLEGLPIFGGLLLVALITRQTVVTDPLALTLLGARLVQSLVHLISLSVPAVFLRFAAFAVQLAIAGYWAFGLLSGFVS